MLWREEILATGCKGKKWNSNQFTTYFSTSKKVSGVHFLFNTPCITDTEAFNSITSQPLVVIGFKNYSVADEILWLFYTPTNMLG